MNTGVQVFGDDINPGHKSLHEALTLEISRGAADGQESRRPWQEQDCRCDESW